MAVCSHCGEPVVEGASFCANCGAPLKEEPAQVQETDPYAQPSYAEPSFEEPVNYDPPQSSSYNPVPVEPIPTGALFAWSVAIILFCTIPGVIALLKVREINKATSAEEQMQKLSSAKKWLIAGTVLAVLNLIIQLTARMQ